MNSILIISFIVLICPYLAMSKMVEKNLNLMKEPMSFLTKFTFSGKRNLIEVSAKYESPIIINRRSGYPVDYIHFAIVSEYQWEQFLVLSDCQEKLNSAEKQGKVNLAHNGQWSELPDRIFVGTRDDDQKITFFIYAMDCNLGVNKNMRNVIVRTRITNSGGSQFSVEENGILKVYSILAGCLVLAIIFSFVHVFKQRRLMRIDEGPMLVLIAATFAQLTSVLAKLLHVWIYAVDGVGSAWLNGYSICGQITAEITICILLIQISRGWTIDYKDIGMNMVYFPLYVILILMHIVISGLTYAFQDEALTHHDYGGYRGLLLVILRMILMFVFLVGINERKQKSSPNVIPFANTLGLLGSIYFLSFPGVIIISYFIPVSSRYVFVLGTNAFIQGFTIWALYRTFSSSKNLYFKISTKSKTILPTTHS